MPVKLEFLLRPFVAQKDAPVDTGEKDGRFGVKTQHIVRRHESFGKQVFGLGIGEIDLGAVLKIRRKAQIAVVGEAQRHFGDESRAAGNQNWKSDGLLGKVRVGFEL